jgi:hypothetical protein
MMNQLSPRLDELGNALEQAAAADLAGSAASPPERLRQLRPHRRVLLAAAALAIALPGGGAIAAALLNDKDVSRSIVAGGFIFQGTHPTCTVVSEGVEYNCTLDKPPIPEITNFKGTVYQTVDATHHVNGGCRGLTSDGHEWECWIGQGAVDQKIISQDFLGELQTVPARG